MTVVSNQASASYAANGSSTSYTIPFPYIDPNDIVVTVTAPNGAVTTLVLGTDYTVSPTQAHSTGTLKLTAASNAPAGTTLKIARTVALTQTTSLRQALPYPFGATIENALDKLTMGEQQIANTHAADKAAQDARDDAQDAALAVGAVGGSATFVTATGSTTARSLAARFSDVVNVRDYGAKGDGVTDDTAAILAAIAALTADSGVVFFPESPQPYLTQAIQLTSANPQVIFAGAGLRASRVRITSATAGGYGIAFTAADNSWGGFRNIRIETAVALGSVIYVLNPANAFLMERTFVSGFVSTGVLSDYCITIDGTAGVGFTGDWTYTTGAGQQNVRITNLTSGQYVLFLQGNHDVGVNGFLSVEAAASSGGNTTFIGTRFEGVGGKDLFLTNTQSSHGFHLINCIFAEAGNVTATAPNSVVKKVAGARASWYLDVRFQATPTNIYVDVVTPANNIAAVAKDFTNPILDVGYVHFGSRRIWFDANGRLREYLGAPPTDTSGYALTPRRVAPTYGAAIVIDTALGDDFTITPTDGNTFGINTPTNPYLGGQRITIRIVNTFGVLGGITWGGQYKLSAWTQPANGFTRSITFAYDGSSKWIEAARTTADVPN